MHSERHIHRLYDQGAERIFRLVRRLEQQLEDAAVRLTRTPQPVINLLTKELSAAKRGIERQRAELLRARQLNHQLLQRIRELETAVERGTEPLTHVTRDSHNSSLPPSSDPPWRRVPRTRSLRQKSGRKVGGQHGHPGATLRRVPQPDHIIVHTAASCAACAASLSSATTTAATRRQVFDLAGGHLRVTEHRAQARRCASCALVTKAAFPPGVRAPAQYGTGVLEPVMNYELRLRQSV